MLLRYSPKALMLPLLLAFIALSSAIPHPALSQTESLTTELQLDINFGFADRFRSGFRTPVRLTATNHGPRLDGELSVIVRHGSPLVAQSHTTTYTTAVQLATGVTTAVELHPLISNSYHPLRIELRDTHGRLLHSETLDLHRRAVNGDIVIAFDPTGRQWSWLQTETGTHVSSRGQRSGLEVVYVDAPQDVPDAWIAYHGVSAVAIDASFPLHRLTERQAQALGRWVEAGGRIIWAGGHRIDATRSSLLHTHSPLDFTGSTHRLQPMSVTTRYPSFPEHADLIVWSGGAPKGHILAQSGEHVLVARREHGRGSSFVMTFDPNALAMNHWTGLGDLARDALADAQPVSAHLGEAEGEMWQFTRSRMVPFPGRTWPATLLLGYVVSLSAVAVIFSRRATKQPFRPTLMILGLVALFTVAPAIVLGPAMEGSRHAISELTVTMADATGAAERYMFQAIYSHVTDEWQIVDAPVGWTQKPMEQLLPDTSDPGIRINYRPEHLAVHLPARTLGRFQSIEPSVLPLQTALTLQGRDYQVSVKNNLDTDIEFLYYVDPRHHALLGSLVPGDSSSHQMPSAIHSSTLPAPEWIGSAVASDMIRRAASETDRRLSAAVGALVTQRLREGARRLSGDDGFLVGILRTDTSLLFMPQASHEVAHIFIMDLALQGRDR